MAASTSGLSLHSRYFGCSRPSSPTPLQFLPWLNATYKEVRVSYQSGLDTVLNDFTLDEAVKKENPNSGTFSEKVKQKEVRDKFAKLVGPSYLTGAAILALCGALVASFGGSSKQYSGLMTAMALALLAAQAAIGFPLKRTYDRGLEKSARERLTMARWRVFGW